MVKWQIHPPTNASVAELEYAHGLEPCGETLAGPNPAGGMTPE